MKTVDNNAISGTISQNYTEINKKGSILDIFYFLPTSLTPVQKISGFI